MSQDSPIMPQVRGSRRRFDAIEKTSEFPDYFYSTALCTVFGESGPRPSYLDLSCRIFHTRKKSRWAIAPIARDVEGTYVGMVSVHATARASARTVRGSRRGKS